MELSHHNYELYALDFLEGRLSPEDEEKFRAFLDLNPDLKHLAFSDMDLSLQPGRTIFPNKDFLKKTTEELIQGIPEPDLDCISLLENSLNKENKVENILPSFMDSSRRELFLLYKKTILKHGNEKFPEKSNLKKPIAVNRQLYWWGSVAATLLLGLIIKVLFIPVSVQENISENSENKILVPIQNAGQEGLVSINTEPEGKDYINYDPAEEPSANPIANSLKTRNKTSQVLADAQTYPLNSFHTEEIYDQLSPLSLRTDRPFLLEKQLKPSVIYIPRVLTQQDLATLENYSIEDFRVELISIDASAKAPGKKFITALRSSVELVSALTGGDMNVNTSYNSSGRLASLNLTSEHLRFSTQRKSD